MSIYKICPRRQPLDYTRYACTSPPAHSLLRADFSFYFSLLPSHCSIKHNKAKKLLSKTRHTFLFFFFICYYTRHYTAQAEKEGPTGGSHLASWPAS